MSQAQFTIPLITVIPGQLITATLWNNEFLNLQTNLNPSGIGGYSDTDTQMQIQTAPYPGSVTSHATTIGGELERIRYQIALMLTGNPGNTFWYQSPPINLEAASLSVIPVGGCIDYPSATPPSFFWALANGQAIGRSAYPALFSLIGTTFGAGNGSTTFNLPNYTDKMSIAAGNLYALAATGGAVSNTPTITANFTDPGHNHTQNSHTHSTPNHTHVLAGGGRTSQVASGESVVDDGSGNLAVGGIGGGTTSLTTTTTSGGGSTSGSTTPTNNSNTTGITVSPTSSSVPTLPPYIGMYKMIRIQ